MTYYPDLSSYNYHTRYHNRDIDLGTKNIGWLGEGYEYSRGAVPEGFTERLWIFCHTRMNQSKGFHECELCDKPVFGLVERRGNEELMLGSAEIRVFSLQGAIYAAPDMIYHYVVEHGYKPPVEFVDAVLYGPAPDTPEYRTFIEKYYPDG